MSLSPSTADLVIHGGVIVSPDAEIRASLAITRRRDQRDRRARNTCRPRARRSTSPGCTSCRAQSTFTSIFAIPVTSTKRTLPAARPRPPLAGSQPYSTCRTPFRPSRRPRRSPPSTRIAREKAYVDFGLYAVLGEESLEAIEELIDVGVDRLQALHGQHLRPHRHPHDRGDAGALRARRADRQAYFAARRNQLDHGTARIAAARRGPHRCARASRRASRRRRRRSGRPGRHPRRMDRRAHPRAAHLLGGRTASARRSQSARRRHHRRDLPALSDAVGRGLRPTRRRHPGEPAGARSAEPSAVVGAPCATASST